MRECVGHDMIRKDLFVFSRIKCELLEYYFWAETLLLSRQLLGFNLFLEQKVWKYGI